MNDTNTQLLTQLVALQKKSSRRQLILIIVTVILALVIAVMAIVVIPPVTTTLKEVTALAADVEESMDGFDDMIKTVNTIMTENSEGIADALAKIDAIDIDSLNASIKSLSEILEPIAEFFNIFN